jgi:hypothetical protein
VGIPIVGKESFRHRRQTADIVRQGTNRQEKFDDAANGNGLRRVAPNFELQASGGSKFARFSDREGITLFAPWYSSIHHRRNHYSHRSRLPIIVGGISKKGIGELGKLGQSHRRR